MNGTTVDGLRRRYTDNQVVALDMFFNLRCQGLVPGTTTAQLFAVAGNPLGTAQIKPTSAAPYNTAPTASPVITGNEAQQGLKFYPTHIMLANPNGTLRTVGNTQIQINNLTQGNTVFDSAFVVSPGAEPSAVGQSALYQVSGGNGNTLFCRAIQPYDSLQVSLTMSGTGGSGTATGVDVLLFGTWQP